MVDTNLFSFGIVLLIWFAQCMHGTDAHALDGGTLRLNTFNGWKAFEVITQGDDPAGDGFSYSMLSTFDGVGAWLVDASTLRVLVNHETIDAAISEVNLDIVELQIATSGMIDSDNTGGGSFVDSARQAYDRWSNNGGDSWTNTSDTSNTSFSRFCSGQAYAPDTFGDDRGFVDEIYVTGEEGGDERLFALDSASRDLYQLSGTVGSAPGGTGGMPFDVWENAALLDTGEESHVALLLSPDGGSQRMQLYIGEKGKDASGSAASSFLSRNGLAFGSWYYLTASYPGLGNTNNGGFDTSIAAGVLTSSKLEDVDTSPSDPTQVVLGDQDSGVFIFDFDLVFGASFDSGASSFTITKISDTSGGANSLNNPDNVDWTDATTLAGTPYPDGIIFVNEDNGTGEIWRMEPDGTDQILIASTNVGEESSGILDISALVGYMPGSILMTNGQGSPSSLSVLINPEATETTEATPIPTMRWMGHAFLALLMILSSRGASPLWDWMRFVGLAMKSRSLTQDSRGSGSELSES
ncbi:MAG TPA: hypothetical protein EYG46_11725 [Myxococcales bacterium]|nr:hypothetical protein [Myxococcales bacterium]HIM01649.1 hypothetical protein [Myxococcales bacterium]